MSYAVPGSATQRSNIGPSDRSLRWAYRASALFAVAPIIVAAVQNGLRGWEPTSDIAITALRIRDVFSAHPPLIGFLAMPSHAAEQYYSFPGALQLYLLAVPVQVLGTTWGLLLGMAVINTAALLAALWLVRRRVGEHGAILAAVFVASLLWTLGSQVIIDPTPMQMGILPFFTLLVAAWSVADGDGPALVILAAVGNYLILDQLTFTLVAPVLGVVALTCWVGFLLRSRREHPEGWLTVKRRQLRWLATALLVTFVVWIPPLYEQFTHPSGNLGKLVDALTHGGGESSSTTLSGALGAVVSVTAVPPLWLPPSFADTPFDVVGGGQSLLIRIVGAGVLLGVFVAAVWWAQAKNDRTSTRGLLVAFVAWWAWVATWLVNPSAEILPIHYFWSLWPLSAFLWFVILMAAVRRWPGVLSRWHIDSRHGAVAGCILVVCVSLLAIPHRDNCGGLCVRLPDRDVAMAREIRSATAHATRHKGPVVAGRSLHPHLASLYPTMLLGLQDAGVPFLVDDGQWGVEQFGEHRDARMRHDARARLELTTAADVPAEGNRIGTFQSEPEISSARYAELNERMERWAPSEAQFPVDSETQLLASERRSIYRLFVLGWMQEQQTRGDLVSFAQFIYRLEGVGIDPDGGLYDIAGLTPDEVSAWAVETVRRDTGPYYLYEIPLR